MKSSFSLTGKVNLGSKSPAQRGADGIGLAFHTGNTTDLGGSAGDLGVVKLKNATGFVVDSYQNPGDPVVPYGAFLKTDASGKRLTENSGLFDYQLVPSSIYDGQFHDFSINYDGDQKIFTVMLGGQTWKTQSIYSTPLAFSISASTGTSNNKQQVSISSFLYKLASAIAVHYYDTDGNEIHSQNILNGNVGDTYDVSNEDYKLEIPGYTLDQTKLPSNSTGVITEDLQVVNYVYTKDPVAGGNITAEYVDTEGNKISEDIVKSGNVGDNYSTEQKTIAGYTFKEVQGSATGTFTDQAQTVTYVYTKDPVAGGNITAEYVDTEGNKISEDIVKSGNVGDNYSTEQKTIAGYTFKEVQGSATGTFTDQAQTVTYVYTKDRVNSTPDNNKSSHNKDISKPESSSTQNRLPETGENERMVLMSSRRGLILLTVALIVSVFRFKMFKDNK